VDLRSSQFLMGHTSLLSTQRYLRLRPQNVDFAVSPLSTGSTYRWPKPCWPPVSGRQRQEAALNWPISFAPMASPIARNHPLPVSHLKVIEAVERCRTAVLGGHLERCDSCGFERPAYNSCRNRHCPSANRWRS